MRRLAASFNACLATPEGYARQQAALRFAVGEVVEVFVEAPDTWVDATITVALVTDRTGWDGRDAERTLDEQPLMTTRL